MATKRINLIFGVDGGGQIEGASGKIITKELAELVKNINNAGILKLKFEVDPESKRKISEISDAIAEKISKSTQYEYNNRQQKQFSHFISSLRGYYKLLYDLDKVKLNKGEESKEFQEIAKHVAKAEEAVRKYGQSLELTGDQKEKLKQLREAFEVRIDTLHGRNADTTQLKEQAQSYDGLLEKLRAVNELETKLWQTRISKGEDNAQHNKIKSQWEEAQKSLENYRQKLTLTQEQEAEYAQLIEKQKTKISQLDAALTDKEIKSADTTRNKWKKMYVQMGEYIQRYGDFIKKNPELYKEFQDLQQRVKEGYNDTEEARKKTLEDVIGFYAKVHDSGVLEENIFDRLSRSFYGRLRAVIASIAISKAYQSLTQIYKNVVAIDDAMTELKIVVKSTDEVYQRFGENVAKAARQIGVAVSDLINSTTTFAKLGYSLDESSIFAKLTTMYSNVSGVGVDEATRNLTAIIKAYNIGANRLERVLDQMLYVANNYAIDPNEIGEAMNNAGSILAATGNSFEEAMGILLAANTTLQNVSKSSTAVRTIAARISASSADLEELGEDVSDVIATADLDKKMRAFGVAITDANGNLRSTYDILNDLSKVWGDLNNTQRAAIAGLLAGTRQQSPFYSIMDNWSDAVKAAEGAKIAAGELQEANAIYLDSISGRLKQLEATFQSFSNNVLDSDLVKGVVSIFTWLISGLEKISSLLGGFPVTIIGITGAATTILTIVEKINKTKFLERIKNTTSAFGGLIKAGLEWVKVLLRQKTATEAAAAATKALNTITTGGLLTLLSIVGYGIYSWISSLDSWEDKIKDLKDKIADNKEEIRSYQEEIDVLEDLQKRLRDAYGDKAKLASIYNELNNKIRVSTDLVNGEEEAYRKANQRLQDRIEMIEDLRNKALESEIKNSSDLFNTNKIKREVIGVDWLIEDLPGEEARFLAQIEALFSSGSALKLAQSPFDDIPNIGNLFIDTGPWQIDALNKVWEKTLAKVESGELSDGAAAEYFRNQILKSFEIDESVWNDFWRNQVNATLSIFQKTISNYSGQFGSEFIEEAVKNATLGGLIPDQIKTMLDDIASTDKKLEGLLDSYYDSLYDDNIDTQEILGQIQWHVKVLKAKYPALSDQLKAFTASLSNNVKGSTAELDIALKNFVEILDKIGKKYDVLNSASKDMEQYGYISADVVASILKDYKELEKYLEFTTSGYRLAEGALDDYVASILQEAKAEILRARTTEEYNTALKNLEITQAVIASIRLSAELERQRKAIEDQKSALESQRDALKGEQDVLEERKDALNEQLDAYKKLIDLRKKLLNTMVDEINYQKELAKKQKTVADLETKLAIAKLDTSAAGRAKVRELEDQLNKAKEDLDDFTLSHAVDMIIKQMDDEYEQYELYINGEVKKITDAIEDVARAIKDLESKIKETGDNLSNIKIEVDPIINIDLSDVKPPAAGVENYPISIRDAMKNNRNPSFVVKHSGGFVTDSQGLKDSEVFAKLLKGEFVSTPAQMKNFIQKTLPSLVSNTSTGNLFNAPLVNIQCGSITKDALPSLKVIVDNAVNEVRKILDSGMSRVGYKKALSALK